VLTGADDRKVTGGGEGGNVFLIGADGTKLRRFATGFWNPFGSGRDVFGRLFVVDNDPDASPPCRLLHVVERGDYGFQFRYGRAGRHPFQAWNGELPGTLPMAAGTGESPCEVIAYESDGLPDEYRGELLVPAWADHCVERYTLKPKGASFTAERKPFVQGGKDFYPSGLTVAPDGSLFVSDWGSRSYELHGKGAIWHIKWKDAKPTPRPQEPKEAFQSKDRKTREAAAWELVKSEAGRKFLREQLGSKDVRHRAAAVAGLDRLLQTNTDDLRKIARTDPEVGLREMALRGIQNWGVPTTEFMAEKHTPAVRAAALRFVPHDELPVDDLLTRFLTSDDPFLRHAGIQRLGGTPELPTRFDPATVKDPRIRTGLLLALRRYAIWNFEATAGGRVADFLKDSDPDVRFLAVKWVSDEKLDKYRPQIVAMLNDDKLDYRGYVALATALARLDNKPVNDDSLAAYFLDRLNDTNAPASTRLMALRAVPATHKNLKTDALVALLNVDDPAFRVEALRALKDRGDAKATPAVRKLAVDARQPTAVRAQAVLTLAAMTADAGTFVALASDDATRDEAFRALVGAKLTDEQGKRLFDAANGKDGVADLYRRVIGKTVGDKRPNPKDTDAWLTYLDGKADAEAGRRVFESTKLVGCYKCHRVEGRGADVGPDLSLIGRTERKWIVESILQPSAVVAPHYQAWQVRTADGRTRTGLLVGTHLDRSVYVDETGGRFEVLAGEVEDVRAAKNSIMPDGLLDALTDQEIRDLIAYLASRK
jgi:putative heme-binding domain-containing protein